MSLPLPRVVPDVGPGGGLLNSLNAINSFANNAHSRRYNKVKADYADLTIPAQAYSQLAYANAVGPQFIAKLMQNPAFMANLSEDQKKNLKDMEYTFGNATGNRSINNINNLNNLPQHHTGVGQPGTNSISGSFVDKLKNALGIGSNSQQQSPQNPMQQRQQPIPQNGMTSPNGMNMELNEGMRGQQQALPKNADLVNNNPVMDAYEAWRDSPEGQRELSKGEKANIPTEKEVLEWANPTQQQREKTYAENTGEYLGTQKQGEESGKFRAKNINDIGEQQLGLSKTGAVVDKLVDDFTSPDFIKLREDFPFLQDVQLKTAAITGSPEQRFLLGKIISDIESFKGATVNDFKGQTLKREFDYADKLKPSGNDTVYTALGKLQSLKSLKEIAYKKNELISKFIDKDKMSLSNAVQKADKMIDIKSIAKKVENLTAPMIRIKNKKDPSMNLYLTKSRAKELGFKYE